ncbi:MAG: efflux RND transporter periplasmic adaptor subunit [Thermosynechococcaceae cyanobacterium]
MQSKPRQYSMDQSPQLKSSSESALDPSQASLSPAPLESPPTSLSPHPPMQTSPIETLHEQNSKPKTPPQPPPWKRLPRRLPYWLAGLGLLTLAVLAFRPQPIPVDLGTVKRGTLAVTVDAEGKTRVRDRFTVAAPVTGRLNRIDLDPGDPIQQGTIIARIDPLPLTTQVREAQARLRELQAQKTGVDTQRPKTAALAQAEAQIQAAIATQQQTEAQRQEARATLAQTTRDRQRAQELEAAGAQSRKVREDAELAETRRQQEFKVAQHQVQVAIANVASARKALAVLQAERKDPDYLKEVYQAQIASTEASLTNLADEARRTVVRAPSSGNVLRVTQQSARFVQAGDPLLELGQSTQLELVIDVLSADAVQIKPGDAIKIEHWGGEQSVQAQVRYIEPSAFTEVSALGVEEQRVNVIANFTNAPTSIGDGYRVEAQIVVWEGKDVLKVPLSALFRCEDQAWCTFVAEQGKAQKRQVAISQRSDLEAVIDQGLRDGEQVILHPTEQIKTGQSVSGRT